MNDRLIRAAIAFYPREWRLRYGGELEQLITDACGASSRLKKAWLVVGVAGCGIRERVPKRIGRNAPRIAGAAATFATAAVAVLLVSGADSGNTPRIAPLSPVTLAPGVRLSSLVTQTHTRLAWPQGGQRHIYVSVDPASGTLMSITGEGSKVEMNPKTEQILSVRRCTLAYRCRLPGQPTIGPIGSHAARR